MTASRPRPQTPFQYSQRRIARRSTKDSVHSRAAIKSSILKLKQRLRQCVNRALVGSSTLNYGNFAIRTCPFDIVRLVSEINVDSDLDLSIRNIFLNGVLSCEKQSPGSGFICAAILSGVQIEENKKKIYRCTEKEIETTLANYLDKFSYSYKICIESFLSSGPGSNIFFKKINGDKFTIKTHKGKIITAKKHEIFTDNISKIENPRVCFIDGILESLGEIDNLLQNIASEKIPVCIFARGFDTDIVQTLDYNFKNNHLNVIPIVYSAGEDDDVLGFCSEIGITCFEPRINNNLRKAVIEDLTAVDMVSIQKSSVTLSSVSGDQFYVEIGIPNRFESVFGILKDRITIGKLFIDSCVKRGVASNVTEGDLKGFSSSIICYVNAKSAAESIQTSLNNLHRVIIQ